MKNMKKFYIIANSDKDKDLVVTHELEEYLKSKEVAYHIHVITPKEDAGNGFAAGGARGICCLQRQLHFRANLLYLLSIVLVYCMRNVRGKR